MLGLLQHAYLSLDKDDHRLQTYFASNFFCTQCPTKTIPADTPKAVEKAVAKFTDDWKIALTITFKINRAKKNHKNSNKICFKCICPFLTRFRKSFLLQIKFYHIIIYTIF